MAAYLAPPPKARFFDANGDPLDGGLLYSYAAGTTTPLATYTDQGGLSANTNPIILDSSGSANVWLSNAAYKLVLKDSTGAITYWTEDNITGVGVLIGNVTVNGTLTVTGATTLQSSLAVTNNITAGGNLSITGSSTLTGPATTGTDLTVGEDLTVTATSTLTGVVTAGNAVNEHLGTDIASASTVDLHSATGNTVSITGTVTITAVTLGQGERRLVRFDDALILTNGVGLILPTGANIITAAGDYATFVGNNGIVEVSNYQRASGQALLAASFTKAFTSTYQTMSQAGALTLAHGLGTTPTLFQARIKCLTTEGGYSVGDIVPISMAGDVYASSPRGTFLTYDGTNIYVKFCNSTEFLGGINKSTGDVFYVTFANWQWQISAWA